MAENEAKEGEAGDAKAAGGGIKALLLPIISSAITAAIVGVVFMMMAPKPQPVVEGEGGEGGHGAAQKQDGHGGESGQVTTEHEESTTGQGKPTGIYHKYDPLIITIFDHEQVHYLKAGITLELIREEVKEEIAAKDPQIRDSIIFILGDFTMRELLDNQGKTIVKESMIKTLNKILGTGKIVNVYFNEYTVQ